MEPYIFYLIILLVTGVGIGFLSGLLGVGGGFLMVPILYWLMISLGIDTNIAIRVSLGTSLAVILPTALSGAYGHYRKEAVLVRPMLYLAATGIIGGFIGGTIASNIPGDIMTLIFGFTVIFVAFIMIITRNREINGKQRDNVAYYVLGGLFIGMMSGLLGVGGGFIIVPFMALFMRCSMHEAIGTSTAVIVFTSIGGIISYIINGWGVAGLPPYSLGYINMLQLVLLAVTSIPMAQFGVRAAHSLPSKHLNYIFVVLLVYVGLRMIGIL
jgi:hypothetical protein